MSVRTGAADSRRSAPARTPIDVPRLGFVAVAAVTFAIYLGLAPSVPGDKDSSEFTLVLATNGVAHPTGYPLYTLAGHAFVSALHTLGASWAFAANAWSALGGALAMGLLFRLAGRLIPRTTRLSAIDRSLHALAPVALIALNPIWTVETTLAEVNSWHIAWVCAAALHFAGSMRALEAEPRDHRTLARRAAGWGLLCGLGAAHHSSALLVAAPLTLALLIASARAQRLSIRLVGIAIAAALVPLTSLLIVAWRAFHPAQVQWAQLGPSLESVVAHLTGLQYRAYSGRFAPSSTQLDLLGRFVWPFLGLGMAMLVAATWRARGFERATLGGLLAAALLTAAIVLGYGVPDPATYFLAPMVLGLAAFAPFVAMLVPDLRTRIAAVSALVVALLLAPGWLRLGQSRRALYQSFEQLVHGMWASIPAERGFVFWHDDMNVRLRGYQLLQSEKPQLEVLDPVTLVGPVARTAFRVRHGFDPLEGLSVPDLGAPGAGGQEERFVEEITHAVNRRSALPVIVFDPRKPSVALLRKDSAPRP